jgi:phosphate transport system substrate-binding protein
VEESLTSGRIRGVVASEAFGLMAAQRSAFEALYPHGAVAVEPGTSRSAVAALFAAECDVIAITRELTAEERSAAVAGGLEVEGYRFARSAVMVIVNPMNPIENLALDELRRVYAGDLSRWDDVSGIRGEIHPVSHPPASDVAEYFVEEVLGGESIRARTIAASGDSAVVKAVAADRFAIGYVTLGTATTGVKTVRLAAWTGLPYSKPDLEAVYEGRYPLTRYFNLFVRGDGKPLARGFITFVTSREGQSLVREAGLVPTSVPVRFVRRSPMLGAHPGDSTRNP